MTLQELIASIETEEFTALVEAQNYPAIAAYLNEDSATESPNPEPQGTVPAPIDMVGLRSLLTPSEVAFFVRPRSINGWLADALDNPVVLDKTVLLQIIDRLLPEASGELPLLTALRGFVDEGDREALGALATVFAQTGDLSESSAATIQAALAATIPDPSWTATITERQPSLAATNGLGTVTAIDVQGALN